MGLGVGAVRMVTESLGLSILIPGFVDATAFLGGSEFPPRSYRIASIPLVAVSLSVVLAHPKFSRRIRWPFAVTLEREPTLAPKFYFGTRSRAKFQWKTNTFLKPTVRAGILNIN